MKLGILEVGKKIDEAKAIKSDTKCVITIRIGTEIFTINGEKEKMAKFNHEWLAHSVITDIAGDAERVCIVFSPCHRLNPFVPDHLKDFRWVLGGITVNS